MEYIHYLVVIPLIVVIIVFQARVLKQALVKIDLFRGIFPSNKHSYSLNAAKVIVSEKQSDDSFSNDDDDDDDSIWREGDSYNENKDVFQEIEISQIEVKSDNTTMRNITDALNMYLEKNKGAVSDFSLMKDIVERYSGAEEEEITVMQPIPLYMGLMGTMIGIIVGISIIAINGGVQQLSNVSSMMTCVAIAMVASFLGILFTTYISWKSKGAKTLVENNKNIFYSWLQTELLPVLSGNTVTALSLLQSNLMTFNQTFRGNIEEFDTVLASVRKVSSEQAEALNAINKIDVTRVAKANISVLSELQKCTSQLERFSQYIHSVNDYLNAVNSLNNNLSDHLDRTAAIEKMGSFFERELEQVQTREEYFKQVVNGIDNTLEESFRHLKSTMDDYINELKKRTTTELDDVREAFEQNQKEFISKLKDQQDSISKKTEEIDKMLQSLQSLSETKDAIKSISETSRNTSKRLDDIIRVIQSNGLTSINGISEAPAVRPVKKWRYIVSSILNTTIKLAALIAFVIFVIDYISKHYIK